MIRRLDPAERPRAVLEQVLARPDPFSWPFTPALAAGLVLYPTEGYHLTERQYEAFRASAVDQDQTAFSVSVVEYADPWAQDTHWSCTWSTSYSDYLTLPLVLENAHYALDGTWAVVLSHEDHGVVGGTHPFVQALRGHYSEGTADSQRLRDHWQAHPNGEWVSSLLDSPALQES